MSTTQGYSESSYCLNNRTMFLFPCPFISHVQTTEVQAYSLAKDKRGGGKKRKPMAFLC